MNTSMSSALRQPFCHRFRRPSHFHQAALLLPSQAPKITAFITWPVAEVASYLATICILRHSRGKSR
ncbi:hypothetical protein E2C01_097337 [Portunus trituberculatus]|uniref:Uncharacterized protein n=1 Tax=Portunus trituberculatus TaxID=210409 RepID=A0A5B7JUX4_PORTR|nr:hypothetical protein [Portunus trituberculatus]